MPVFPEVPKAIPEKQGLKLHCYRNPLLAVFRPKGHSRKTRIETMIPGRQTLAAAIVPKAIPEKQGLKP